MPFHVSERGNAFLNVGESARRFLDKVEEAESEAASVATQRSRMQYDSWVSGRPFAPARRKRPTTNGGMGAMLHWQVGSDGMVVFDRDTLDNEAPYWVIQEIGTGQSARILNPEGEVRVKSQVGRELPKGLFYWGVAGGEPAQWGGLHQLFPVSSAPSDPLLSPYAEVSGRIRREIKGKHFVQKGGIAGYDVFRDSLLAAFNGAFV